MRTLLAVLLTACVACGGATESSSGTGPGPAATVPPAPAPVPTPAPGPAPAGISVLASLDTACDGDASMTGRPVVDAIGATPYTGTYSGANATAASALTLTVTYAGGAIRCHPAYHGNTGGVPDTRAYVDVDLRLQLTTADGTFAETLVAAAELRGDAVLFVTAPVTQAELKGTFAPTPMPGFDVLTLMISGTFGRNSATSGNVQQIGAKSATPAPGTVNPSRTQSAGSWQ